MRAWTLCCFHSFIRTQTLHTLVDSCAEIKSAPSVGYQFWQSLEEGARKQGLELECDDTAMCAATKSVFKRQPRTITVCAFKNGTRDTFIHASAPTLKIVSAFKFHTFTSMCAL